MEPMLKPEAEILTWLRKRKIEFNFHSTLLGANPEFGVKAPFTLRDHLLVIGFKEDLTGYDPAIVESKGFTLLGVSKDTPIADLEGQYGS